MRDQRNCKPLDNNHRFHSQWIWNGRYMELVHGKQLRRWFVIFIARELSQGGRRTLREVATLLAKAGFTTRTHKPYGPAAIRQMLQSDEVIPEYLVPVYRPEWFKVRQEILASKTAKEREAFQWLKPPRTTMERDEATVKKINK